MSVSRHMGVILALLAVTVAEARGQAGAAPPQASSGPVPAAQAAGRMTVPEGFRVTLFAAEPDVRQPIAFTIDPKGRLWVVECYSYPDWKQSPPGEDRILIFEDTDGDGHFDRRKVFFDKGANFSGIALGFGGVWVCATPNLLFIPDRNGDDVPDGAPEIRLDGWSLKAQHNVFNAINWGPDGWLYGGNGILATSYVGKPGTPQDARTAINCGVWRYHPTNEIFEVVAHGTTNPWGLDWDDHGELFITNCVIPHVFRVVQGGHYQRMFGQDFNPHLYGLMESCADHIHWAGGRWQDSRGGQGKHGEAGGGHAHAGGMIYLADNWPDEYRDSIFMWNLHGHRVNHDWLSRRGSGYLARHGKDFLFANDDWFRGLELKYGPDGGVFVTDWSDTGECHENDADGAHRENGRIYKVTYGGVKPVQVDLAKQSDEELVRCQLHKNDWYVRTARRLLHERALAGKDMRAAHAALREIVAKNADDTRKLRALWTLYVTRGLDDAGLRDQLASGSESVRSWAVRLLCDDGKPSAAALDAYARLAKDDPAPPVRLALASALQRMPLEKRRPIAEALALRAEDAADRDITLMTWYGIEPLAASDPENAAELAGRARIPLLRQYIARRAAGASATSGLAALVRELGRTSDDDVRFDLLAGINEALRGRKNLAPPPGATEVYAALAKSVRTAVRDQANVLGLTFGLFQAGQTLRAVLMDSLLPADRRRAALEALTDARVAGLGSELQRLLDDNDLRGPALRALAAFDDPATSRVVLERYRGLNEADRAMAVETLASRPASAKALLAAVEKGTVPKRDISTAVARQLEAFRDRQISAALEKAWGKLRPTSKEKTALMAKYKAMLTPESLSAASPSRGRAVFSRTCQRCHTLYATGGDVGPELTGSDRANVDYVLQNVLDPSSAVGRDYQLTTVATTDGRLISGIVRQQDENGLVLQTESERVFIPKADVEDMKVSEASMMPEGLLDPLTPEEVRDLVAYLATKEQVPLAEETK